jgi:hypothetical protein
MKYLKSIIKILSLILIFTCILTKKNNKKIQTRQEIETSENINQKCYLDSKEKN